MHSQRSGSVVSKRKIVCSGCRLRKKKCDGLKPSCSTCQRWGDPCHYITTSSSSYRQRLSSGFDLDFTYESSPQTDGLGFGWCPAVERNGSTPYPFMPASSSGAFSTSQVLTNVTHEANMPSLMVDQNTMNNSSSASSATGFESLDNLLTPSTSITSPDLHPYLNQFGFPDTTESSLFGGSTLSIGETNYQEQATKLLSVLFDKVHPLLPLLHYKSFVKAVTTQQLLQQAPHLYFAFLAICANLQPDPLIRSHHDQWYAKAKELYEETEHNPQNPLPVLQAAVLIIHHAWILGDYSTAWLVLGRAWRQALTVGYHRLDASEDQGEHIGQAESNRIKEEGRRVVWILFLLDRGMNLPVGLQHAIDERHLYVHLPMSDAAFQNSQDFVSDTPPRAEYSANLKQVLASIKRAATNQPVNHFHYILAAYLLAGRISDFAHSPSPILDERQREFDVLNDELSLLGLSIPLPATLLSAASPNTAGYIVWLNAIINAITVLLHHQPTSSSGVTNRSPSWPTCVAAAKRTVNLIQDASRLSITHVLNPHLTPPFYLCGRILAIESILAHSPLHDPSGGPEASIGAAVPTGDASISRHDLDLVLLVFDRMAEAFGNIGVKYRNGLMSDLQRSVEEARQSKDAGSAGLMARCAPWSKR